MNITKRTIPAVAAREEYTLVLDLDEVATISRACMELMDTQSVYAAAARAIHKQIDEVI